MGCNARVVQWIGASTGSSMPGATPQQDGRRCADPTIARVPRDMLKRRQKMVRTSTPINPTNEAELGPGASKPGVTVHRQHDLISAR